MFICMALSLSLLKVNVTALDKHFVSNYSNIVTNNLIAKTNYNTSIYGTDLEENMVEEKPIITSFSIDNNIISVSGAVDSTDNTTHFCLEGQAYKTFDNNIVCNVTDTTNTYDVIFLCLEKKQEYNDYLLYRNSESDVTNLMGNYGLKIYLMKKGTRNISIIEDLSIDISNVDNILASLYETDYSNLNWFTNCFEPVPEAIPYNVTTREYQFIDSVTYYFGTVAVKLGIILEATNDTPTISNQASFTSKLEHSYYVYSDNPSYNQPARAEGYFRVENLNIETGIGQGYYIQQVHWNGAGDTSSAISGTLNLYIGYGSVVGGNITFSSAYKTFNRDNWLNLIDSSCNSNNMPRQVKTEYDGLIISTPSHYADFSATIINSTNAPDKYKCYQTIWKFDITKKGTWGNYSSYRTNQSLTCTSYFS